MIIWLAVIIGGFVGAMLRGYLSNIFDKHIFGTFMVNFLGSIVLAFTVKGYLNGIINDEIFALLGIGFSGSFTTFSTFNVEIIRLLKNKKIIVTTFYLLGSISLSLLTVYLILVI